MSKNNGVDQIKLKASSKFNLGLIISYGIAIASVAFAGAVFMWVILPQIAIYSENKEAVDKLETKLKKVSAQAQYLEELSKVQDQLDGNLALSQEALPVTKDYIPFMLEQLVTFGKQSQVTIDSLGFGGITSADDEGISTVKIQVKISGTYGNVLSFIERLQTARRLVDISTIQVSKSFQNDSANETYSVTMSLISYFMHDVETENISVDALTTNTNYEEVLKKLRTMDYYDVEATTLTVGTDNPFKEGIDIITGEELDFDGNNEPETPNNSESSNKDEFEGFE